MMSAAGIPTRADDITPEWLSEVLSGPDTTEPVRVRDVALVPIGTGQTGATYRASVRYDHDSYSERLGLPGTFAVKLPAQDEAVRERVALGYRAEHAFYTLAADHMKIPVPHCYHCEIDRGGIDFVMLLSDLAPAVQGDQIGGCTPAQARLAVEALAGLHGPSWCDPHWADLPGIALPRPDDATARGLGDLAAMAADLTLEKLGSRVGPDDRDTTRASTAAVTAWLGTEPDRFSLMHGDYRLDNMLFHPGPGPDPGRVTVVDWQTLGAGLPSRDLAYFIATGLLPQVRATAEAGLVQAYHRALLSFGVEGYDRQTCWRDYRLGMLQVPLLTVLGCAFASSTDRGDDMMLVMLQRGCQAIRELDSLELVKSAGP